jgi:hypothetical protein
MVDTGMNSIVPDGSASFGSSYPPATFPPLAQSVLEGWIVPFQQFRQSKVPIQRKAFQNTKPLKRSRTYVKRRQPRQPQAKKTVEDVTTHKLSADQKLLIELRRDKKMLWKDISKVFGEKWGRPYQEAALQMRYKRLKERIETVAGGRSTLAEAEQQV